MIIVERFHDLVDRAETIFFRIPHTIERSRTCRLIYSGRTTIIFALDHDDLLRVRRSKYKIIPLDPREIARRDFGRHYFVFSTAVLLSEMKLLDRVKIIKSDCTLLSY